jgi:hypothetical protein
MINQQNSPQPWYIKKKNSGRDLSPYTKTTFNLSEKKSSISKFSKLKSFFIKITPTIAALFFVLISVFLFLHCYFSSLSILIRIICIFTGVLSIVFSLLCILYQIGSICAHFSNLVSEESKISTGIRYLQGLIEKEESRKGIPAPEMALYQFVQQVRSYATEKSFLKQKTEKMSGNYAQLQNIDPNVILKRRWNDVVDSLNEFEIYLANDPNGIIEKLIAKSPLQNTDVSQIFRDVAETFDTTWRRKGINIEQAIVTPLKANTNEALLRRLLVGPWRSCVYLARRGNEVIFTAKSQNGKIIAHWECEGVVYPEEFYQIVRDSSLSVNERIEKGMAIVGSDPNSPNMLFALISFVTWLDLAKASSSDFMIKQGSEGLIIELNI